MRELPALLQGFREDTNYATFHALKSAFQAYARDKVGRGSELWKGIKQVEDLPKPMPREMAKRAPLVMPWEARLALEVKPDLDSDGAASIQYVSTNAYVPPTRPTSGPLGFCSLFRKSVSCFSTIYRALSSVG
ncbi:MAG TPA: hypothetical protein VFS33_09360 [Gemmatimonadales bacterium]|nr:hypothetical protein [Gemmatimonadales bacterium]